MEPPTLTIRGSGGGPAAAWFPLESAGIRCGGDGGAEARPGAGGGPPGAGGGLRRTLELDASAVSSGGGPGGPKSALSGGWPAGAGGAPL